MAEERSSHPFLSPIVGTNLSPLKTSIRILRQTAATLILSHELPLRCEYFEIDTKTSIIIDNLIENLQFVVI